VEMRKMTLPQKEKYVQGMVSRRTALQEKINAANEKRRLYVAEQMKNSAGANSLDRAILTSVKAEAAKKGFTIE